MNQSRIILSSLFGLFMLGIVASLFVTATILTNRTNLGPGQVATLFYAEWIEQAQEAPRQPLEEELHFKSTYVTSEFGIAVATRSRSEVTIDPVLCSSHIPRQIATRLITEEDSYASVMVYSDTQEQARLVLQKDENGWWRIDEVDCLSNV